MQNALKVRIRIFSKYKYYEIGTVPAYYEYIVKLQKKEANGGPS